ncbi:response regulator [Ketobacter sp. MCCC 1A13808]|uniref:response regulator n=1 Tax=Ketobacter sp. MCCC 1A13808 TaxID=2602738 RepID=UPI000F0E1906|nr:response regulator [Ketobacter sp. MCCC 1A13808]MVF14253.1 response regulator [Ketobacter sp. MCCC 1A13808]RLP53504.1 MAG: response regulator [Ketobacter sp.]
MREIKLLLVEDDEDDYIITRDLLDDIFSRRYRLDWASDLETARKQLSANQHDVCLMDYALGPEDGVSLLKEATALGFSSPIIMLTGQDDERLDEEALSAGAVDYLVKSNLTQSRLARAIRYAIARREMEVERVERLRAQAENRSKSEFLAHLSHELRTPLTSILGYTDLLLKQKTRNDNDDHLQIIKRNGQHLLSLLNDVLDLSKIEAGKFELENKAVNFPEFLSDVYHLILVRAEDKNIRLLVEADQALPKFIEADPTRLRQILLNLLGNAIKFTDSGSVTLQVSWDFAEGIAEGSDSSEQEKEPDIANTEAAGHSDAKAAEIVFAIKDTGIGIEEDEIPKLFKPFSQTKNVESRSENGTGLGLAISQRLAQRLGGGVEVSSVSGEGSCFTVTIKAGIEESVEQQLLNIELIEANRPRLNAQQINARILIADDLPDLRQLLGHLIENTGAQVIFAINGQDAINQVRQAQQLKSPFDLILMDVQMPVMGGLEATQILRKEGFTGPILALTAATMRGERERCLAAGYSDHLSKPVDESQLMERILLHLGQIKIAQKEVTPNHILLVEDDHDTRVITAMLIESLGLEVSQAATGAEAIASFNHSIPDMVLMDLNLPDCAGLELAAQLRSLAKGTSCILVALSGQELSKEEQDVSPFDHHLLKPVNLDVIKQVIA